MDKSIITLYQNNCHNNKNCTPKIKYKYYANGSKHFITQCALCGDSYGQPVSKNKIPKNEIIEPFDENFYNEHYKSFYQPFIEQNQIETKIRDIIKSFKKEYFESILEIPFGDFDDIYEKYLNSSQWAEKRSKILKRDRFTCLVCESNKATEVHHISYANLGAETEWELISVCHSCHETIHHKNEELL